MKKVLIYLGGVATGIIFMFCLSYLRECKTSESEDQVEDVTRFKEPGDVVKETGFRVFQVLADNAALVMGEDSPLTVYLLVNDEGKYYFDDDIIEIPKGKVARQIGIYRYMTKDNMKKTVRMIKIMDI